MGIDINEKRKYTRRNQVTENMMGFISGPAEFEMPERHLVGAGQEAGTEPKPSLCDDLPKMLKEIRGTWGS